MCRSSARDCSTTRKQHHGHTVDTPHAHPKTPKTYKFAASNVFETEEAHPIRDDIDCCFSETAKLTLSTFVLIFSSSNTTRRFQMHQQHDFRHGSYCRVSSCVLEKSRTNETRNGWILLIHTRKNHLEESWTDALDDGALQSVRPWLLIQDFNTTLLQ